ncbi:hypothetical protein, unlikely [Trypanosoma congolense IL3000]|uniref:Uncharacterized protein n=1 Tax=Trypanosoma congolense (strain IL3000) TaxID=1068625 RepID=F9W7J0_TRYCI|nr:hypothetical protein, unlikely [Trypanosoma congolense IL3000]
MSSQENMDAYNKGTEAWRNPNILCARQQTRRAGGGNYGFPFYGTYTTCKEQRKSVHEDAAFDVGYRAYTGADVVSGTFQIGTMRSHEAGMFHAALGARSRL